MNDIGILETLQSSQPFLNEDKTISVVFDGDIFNLKALKEELSELHAQTAVDAVMHGYKQWGIETLLDKLDGAFIFSIHDATNETTYFVRDKFGIKPLYYFQDETGLHAASTLKLLSKHDFPETISKEGLNLFLSLSYIPAPYTIYDSVFKLPAGNYLTVHNGNVALKSYYRLEEHITPSSLTFEQAKEQLRQKLSESVKTRMDCRVPAGAFLSGGIDSSIIAGLMAQYSDKPVPTFSIGFKEKEYDESDRAKLVSDTFRTNHTTHYLDYADVLDVLDDIIDFFDEPYGDSSAIPSFYAAKLASEKVKVVLTGDCADELFGGYDKYLGEYYSKKYLQIPGPVRYLFEKSICLIPRTSKTGSLIRKIKKVIANANYSGFDAGYQYMCMGCSDQVRRQLVTPGYYADIKSIIEKTYNRFNSSDLLNRTMFSDINTVLEGDMFPKVERMCRMNALESRSPFFNAGMAEFALSLPSGYKINGKEKKYILREAFKDLLPAKIFSYGKSGFRAPISHWFRKDLKNDLLDLLDKNRITKQGILNADVVSNLVEQHLKGGADNGSLLWNLFVFQKWYAKHCKNETQKYL
ncbi:MAG: asparagine synthase (glutamine-hydrolyzing) [Prevotellaceae bacterium]|nr:asparagine synthase (glutamine-hydrolyzing) [Prevotellaceae bacterium]